MWPNGEVRRHLEPSKPHKLKTYKIWFKCSS